MKNSKPQPMNDDFITQIIEAARTAGFFGFLLMFFMWWRSDTERAKLQGERDALLERMISVANEVKEALREVTKAIWTSGRKD